MGRRCCGTTPVAPVVHFYLKNWSCKLWSSFTSLHLSIRFNRLRNLGGFITLHCCFWRVLSATRCREAGSAPCRTGIHPAMGLPGENSFICWSTRHLLLTELLSNYITDHAGLSFLSQDNDFYELDLRKFFKVIACKFIPFWFHSPSLWFSVNRKTGYS